MQLQEPRKDAQAMPLGTSRTELIRIEATRSGRFNPVFKEARHGSKGVF